jgi:acetylornithine deacetylase/succinyl-diaminopimelate desuccinylase-like protein
MSTMISWPATRRAAIPLLLVVAFGGRQLPDGTDVDDSSPPLDARAALERLIAFLSVPNSVAEPSAIERNVAHLTRLFEEAGVPVQRLQAGGAPYVFAEVRVAEHLPTVLFYSHYDGVPSDPGRWSSPPYEPTLRGAGGERLRLDAAPIPEDARLFARSAADSKNAIVALLIALERTRLRGGPQVNLKFLFDGEEERESPSLAEVVKRHARELQADLLVSASGEVHQSGLPTVAFGVRGALTLELTVHTATLDLHSGHFGNFAPNAALLLSRLLSSTEDDDGRVRIPGFYDRVRPLSGSEREMIDRVPRIEEELGLRFGIPGAERSDRTLQELINQPTLNVRGIEAGYVADRARNIIPSRASASLDIRLVADMEPGSVVTGFRDWLAAEGWTVVDSPPDAAVLRRHAKVVELHEGQGFAATKSETSGPYAEYVIDAVRHAAWTTEIVAEPTEGGSLKHHLFTDLGMAYAALPTSNFDNNQHTHDENLELRYFWYGIRLFETLMTTRPRPPLRRTDPVHEPR